MVIVPLVFALIATAEPVGPAAQPLPEPAQRLVGLSLVDGDWQPVFAEQTKPGSWHPDGWGVVGAQAASVEPAPIQEWDDDDEPGEPSGTVPTELRAELVFHPVKGPPATHVLLRLKPVDGDIRDVLATVSDVGAAGLAWRSDGHSGVGPITLHAASLSSDGALRWTAQATHDALYLPARGGVAMLDSGALLALSPFSGNEGPEGFDLHGWDASGQPLPVRRRELPGTVSGRDFAMVACSERTWVVEGLREGTTETLTAHSVGATGPIAEPVVAWQGTAHDYYAESGGRPARTYVTACDQGRAAVGWMMPVDAERRRGWVAVELR